MTDVLDSADAADAAVGDIPDGATVLIGGFGTAGQPMELIDALRRHGATELTVVNNNAGNGDHGLAALLKTGNVRKIICSFPRQSDSWVFDDLYLSGRIELEVPVALPDLTGPLRDTVQDVCSRLLSGDANADGTVDDLNGNGIPDYEELREALLGGGGGGGGGTVLPGLPRVLPVGAP